VDLTYAAAGDLLDRFRKAWLAFDGDAWADLFSPDVVYHDGPFDEPLVGRNALRAYLLEATQRQDQLEDVRVAFSVHHPVFDVQDKAPTRRHRREHVAGKREEPVDVLVRMDPGVGPHVGVRRGREEQIDPALRKRRQPLGRICPGHTFLEDLLEDPLTRWSRRSHAGSIHGSEANVWGGRTGTA